MIFQLLNAGMIADRTDYVRRWLHPGEPVSLGRGCTLQLLEHTRDGEFEPVLVLQAANGRKFESPLPAGHQMDARPYARIFIVPRAAEVTHQGRTARVLMEFVRLDKRDRLAV